MRTAKTDFTDKTVLVTGASRGIGLATAQRLSALGARVGVVARGREGLARAQAAIPQVTHAVAADLTDRAECRRAVREVGAALGPIDILVSCAGVVRRDFAEDVKLEDFEYSHRLHVGAAIWLTQQLLPGMRARDYGRIVLVSSELGLIGAPSYASYCTSKWATVALAEVLHHELAGTGVRACAVCPGDVRTDQLREEIGWGATGGASLEAAMDPVRVAGDIVAAVDADKPVVVVDRPHLKAAFNLLGGPRRLRMKLVRVAYRELLAMRRF